MVCKGWRRSWLAAARKRDLPILARSASDLAASSALPSRLASVTSTIATRILRFAEGSLSQHASTHQERPPPRVRQFDLDFMVIDGGASGLNRGQEFPQSGHVEMIARSQQVSADEVLGLDRKNAME